MQPVTSSNLSRCCGNGPAVADPKQQTSRCCTRVTNAPVINNETQNNLFEFNHSFRQCGLVFHLYPCLLSWWSVVPWHHKFARGVRHACQSWEEERQPHENGLDDSKEKEPVSERVSFARACDKNVQTLNGRNAFFAAMLRHAATSWAVPWAHLQGQRSGIAIPKRIATPQISEMHVHSLRKLFMNHARINASSFQCIFFFLLHAGLVLDFFLWWR